MALGSPPHWSDIYHTLYNAEIFLLPLVVILATHIKIYVLLTRLVITITINITVTINNISFKMPSHHRQQVHQHPYNRIIIANIIVPRHHHSPMPLSIIHHIPS